MKKPSKLRNMYAKAVWGAKFKPKIVKSPKIYTRKGRSNNKERPLVLSYIN